MKNPALKLKTVHYASDLQPYIERKLFSVNTGHATVAYTGKVLGYNTIGEAVKDEKVISQLEKTLAEIRSLLLSKWDFEEQELVDYHKKIVSRFENPYISDDIARVGRTPIRKLGYDERFIRPIRELKERNLSYATLMETVGKIYHFDEPADEESQKLQKMLKDEALTDVIKETTGLSDEALVKEIEASVKNAE